MNCPPLRVLHLRSSCGLYGAEQVILSLATHQPAQGVTPLVADFRPPGTDEGPLLRAILERGGEAVPLYCNGRFDPAAVRTLREFTLSRQIDVFHGHDYKANLFGYLALRRTRVPLIATNHGYDGSTLRLALYHYLDARVMRRLDAVIAVANPIAEAMARRGVPEDRITVIHNGIDLDPFVPASRGDGEERDLTADLGIAQGQRLIGTVGRLEPQKGYDLLLAAFAQLLDEIGDIHLVIVGEGSLRKRLEDRARRLGIAERVTFTGARSSIPSLLRTFSLFVSSSHSEGMPLAVLEAAASGLPIVATDVGDVHCLVEDGITGRLVPPNDVDALASAIAAVLADAPLAQQLGDSARRRLEESFSAREAARQTVEVYRQAVSDGRRDAARVATSR